MITFVAWALYVVLIAFYFPAGGDEPGYYYSATLFARGKWPVLDFFAIAPWTTYAPFAAVFRWLSHGWEAARMVCVASILAMGWMTHSLACRAYGGRAAALLLMMMAVMPYWLGWNIQVHHYAVECFGLLAAFYLLHRFAMSPWIALASGIAGGIACNARAPLLVAVMAVGVIALWRGGRADGQWRLGRGVVRGLLPFALGGLLVSLPSIYALVSDPANFIFDLLTFRFFYTQGTVMSADGPWSWLLRVALNHLGSLWGYFFSFTTDTKASYGNCVLLVPPAIAAIRYARMDAARRAEVRARLRGDSLLKGALLVTGAVVFIYQTADMALSNYYLPAHAFLLLISVGVSAHVAAVAGRPLLSDGRGRLVAATVLLAFAANFLFWTGGHIVRRNEPSNGRAATNAQVACWLESQTAPDDRIMGIHGLSVATAGRLEPAGYEYTMNVINLFWTRLDEEIYRRHRILSDQEYLRRLRAGEIPFLVLDRPLTYYIIPPKGQDKRTPSVVAIEETIAADYVHVTGTGGPSPLEIYVHRSRMRDDFVVIPPLADGLRLNLAQLRTGSPAQVVAAIVADISRSVSTLPRDIGESVDRLLDRDYARRCSRLLGLHAGSERNPAR